MPSPAEMPQRDEALKSLIARFKEQADSRSCVELAAALLARGHASEALRVAEHGLQLVPDDVEGRVERAAALLALGRPKVAYVELRRALAIEPTSRRGMRLLGRAYVEAGAPARAAALLAKRSMEEDWESEATPETPTTKPSKPLPPSDEVEPTETQPALATSPAPQPKPPPRLDSERPAPGPSQGAAIPEDLFSDLTKDLGLGSAVPEAPLRRVEVTQIIRRKGPLTMPRLSSELAAIDGPIVDTTQPGGNLDEPVEHARPEGSATVFDAITSPSLMLANLTTMDDEPLFQDFAVRPVETEAPLDPLGGFDRSIDEPPTFEGPSPVPTPNTPLDDTAESATEVEWLQDEAQALDRLPPPQPPPELTSEPDRRPGEAERPAIVDTIPPVLPSEAQIPTLHEPALVVVVPKIRPTYVGLAIAGALLMVLYVAGLFWFSAEQLAPWFDDRTASIETTATDSAAHDTEAAPSSAQAHRDSQ